MIKDIFQIILTFALLFLPGISFGFEVPKDAVIKVYDSKGRQIGEMSRKDYKVVKNEPKKDEGYTTIYRPVKKKVKREKNSLILHAGAGKNGFNTTNLPAGFRVSEKLEPVLGLSVCRTKNSVGVCASGFSHGTVTLGVKQDF